MHRVRGAHNQPVTVSPKANVAQKALNNAREFRDIRPHLKDIPCSDASLLKVLTLFLRPARGTKNIVRQDRSKAISDLHTWLDKAPASSFSRRFTTANIIGHIQTLDFSHADPSGLCQQRIIQQLSPWNRRGPSALEPPVAPPIAPPYSAAPPRVYRDFKAALIEIGTNPEDHDFIQQVWHEARKIDTDRERAIGNCITLLETIMATRLGDIAVGKALNKCNINPESWFMKGIIQPTCEKTKRNYAVIKSQLPQLRHDGDPGSTPRVQSYIHQWRGSPDRQAHIQFLYKLIKDTTLSDLEVAEVLQACRIDPNGRGMVNTIIPACRRQGRDWETIQKNMR